MAITDQAESKTDEEVAGGSAATGMQVQKRDGSKQTVDVNKIVRAVETARMRAANRDTGGKGASEDI